MSFCLHPCLHAIFILINIIPCECGLFWKFSLTLSRHLYKHRMKGHEIFIGEISLFESVLLKSFCRDGFGTLKLVHIGMPAHVCLVEWYGSSCFLLNEVFGAFWLPDHTEMVCTGSLMEIGQLSKISICAIDWTISQENAHAWWLKAARFGSSNVTGYFIGHLNKDFIDKCSTVLVF